MNRRTKIGASIAAGATAVLAATAIAVASPSNSSQADDATPNPSTSASVDNGHTPETPLTGSDAEKATAAALAAVPGGTILRVETDSDGGGSYEAHVRKSDGTEVVVLMDDSFNVTSVEEFTGRGGHGRGDRDPSQAGPGEKLLTGDDAAKATAAAEKAVEGGTILRVETDADGGASYEAHVRKSDGTEVVVLMDDSFKVTSVEEFTGRGGHGRGDRDGDGTSDRDGASDGTTDDATASPTSTTSA
jgi:uncharacterized membrane protein YkoI